MHFAPYRRVYQFSSSDFDRFEQIFLENVRRELENEFY